MQLKDGCIFKMDTFFKKIPFLNKIYNLKQHILNQEHQLQVQQEQIDALAKALHHWQEYSENLARQIAGSEKEIKAFVSKEIVYNTISLQQRMDQFLFDFKISARKDSVK